MSIFDDKSVLTFSTDQENIRRNEFAEFLRSSPIPNNQLLSNLQMYINSKTLSRILFFDHVYRQILNVMGVVMEFGTHWGANLAQFAALRGIYEPFNRHRKIIGFDTFSGFPSIHANDGNSVLMKEGNMSLPEDYQVYLEKIMQFHEDENPMNHIKKYQVVKGDSTVTLPNYLIQHPETIIALAYFDFDIYEPTKVCLQAIKPHLVRGSIIGFDELCDADAPGETAALMEVFGLNNIELLRHQYTSRSSYFVVR